MAGFFISAISNESNGSFETLCAIWYLLCNFKKVKNFHGGVLFLVQLQA